MLQFIQVIIMRESAVIKERDQYKKQMERIRESLIRKNIEEPNSEEIEFLLKRL